MHYPLCIHPQITNFEGSVTLDAGHRLHLSMAGTFFGADLGAPFLVQLCTAQRIALPAWLRAANAVRAWTDTPATCDGSTCLSYRVSLTSGALIWSCDDIDCEEWALSVPCMPLYSLQKIIGMRPMLVKVSQGDQVYATFEVQRMQHCVHLHT